MALWRLYYHFVWATRERRDLIAPEMEPDLYGYIIGKGVALGAIMHAIGGTSNHIHVVSSVPPTRSIADFVKGIKGSSAHHINHCPVRYPFTFGWQGGYGVFSLGRKQLDDAVSYVLRQKEHHAQGTVIAALEEQSQDDDGPDVWQDGEAIRQFPVKQMARTDESEEEDS